jgi:putative transposase
VIVAYIDAHKDRFGVDPICRVLTEHGMAIAPSTYYAHKTAPVTAAELADAYAANAVLDCWTANRGVYGERKLWHALRREGHDFGRDQVARLMRIVGISGVIRGQHRTRTIRRDAAAARHPDLVQRGWRLPSRPDQWWAADFTYVWTLAGFVYVAFLTDVYSRRILGWRVSASKSTELVSSVLEQALFTRRRGDVTFTANGLIHHSDAGSQAVHLAAVHRRAARSRHQRLDRFCRRRAGQRARRVGHRTVQDRAHRPAPPQLERPRRGRAGDRGVGALVQHRPSAQQPRTPTASRVRGALPFQHRRHLRG